MQVITVITIIFGFSQAFVQSIDIDMDIMSVPCGDNLSCRDGEPHYMCVPPPQPCKPFKLLNLSNHDIYSFLLSHNGIRNRVAVQFHIANMNIVHWSSKLQLRAEMFLRKCQRQRDKCQDVGPRESQTNVNSFFHHGMISKNWPSHLVRQWFNEFGYNENWKNFFKRRLSGKVGNYSQLIYPLVQFIGCNGALIPNGYLFVCYYWPRTNKTYKYDFQYGEPCSLCNPAIPACSRVFDGLCGIDIEVQQPNAMGMPEVSFQKLGKTLVLTLLFNWLILND